jgi:hypothetical protein
MLPLRRLQAGKLERSSTSIARHRLGVDRRRRRGGSRPESASITSNIPPQLPEPREVLPVPVSRRSKLIAATAICSLKTAS